MTPVGTVPRVAGLKSPENFGNRGYSKAGLTDQFAEPEGDFKTGRSNAKGGILTEANFRAGASIDQISGIKPQQSFGSPNYYNLGSETKTFLGDQTGQDIDPNFDYYNRRTTMRSELRGSPEQFNRTTASTSRYDDLKAKLKTSDKETSNFLDYLEKFQKDSVSREIVGLKIDLILYY